MQHNPKFLALVSEVRQRVQETDVAAVHAALADANFVLIDVREESEWARGHLPNAVYLGRGIIERDIETLYPDPKTPMVLYCGGGFRSVLAADHLQKMGYQNVVSMDGGFRAWQESGFEIQVNM
jgi:rhodanese-related sulfurtransferase